jgi:hypothetical protein
MAEVKNIKINVDTKQATQAMDDLAKATHDVSASFEEVYGDLQPLTTRMGEAEDRLYELANAGQTATQEYKDLLTTVGNYRKVQIQTDMAVDAAASTMANKLGGALGGATAGFQLVQGAMGAFGAESAQVEEALLKVQSAMAIADGVKGFREAIPSIKAFGSAMKAAIGSTGIGLLVVALGTLAAYWDDIKAAVSGVSAEQSKLNQKTDANVLAQQAKYDAISGQDNILKLQGKSERDILKIKQTQIQAVIKATEAQLVQQEATKKAQVAAAKRNQEILTGILTFLTAPLQLLLGTVDMVGKALGKDFNLRQGLNKSITSLVFDPKQVAEEGDKVIDETKTKLAQLKNEAAGFTIALREMDKPAEKVVKDSGKKAVEEAKKEVEVMETLKTNSLKSGVSTLLKTRQEELLIEKQASDDKIALKEQELEALAIIADAENKIRDANISNIAAGIDLVKNLFANNKKIQAAALIAESAVAIARTIISTKAANQAARAQGTAASILTGGASVIAAEALVLRNNIGAGISIAAQIAATAKGVSALGGGGTPPSNDNSPDGGGGGGGSFSPNFNVVGNSGMNQLAQLQQQPVQAYVVSGEVTSAQALDRNRVKNATL